MFFALRSTKSAAWIGYAINPYVRLLSEPKSMEDAVRWRVTVPCLRQS